MIAMKVVYHFLCYDVFKYRGNVMLQNARAIFNRQFYEYGLENFSYTETNLAEDYQDKN